MPITYDVYINDSPLAGHIDLTLAQLRDVDGTTPIWRSLNSNYPVGTNLKVQVMAKDGALTSLSDAVSLVVPVAYYDAFTAVNGTALDTSKWQTYKAREATGVLFHEGTNVVIQNNAALVSVAPNTTTLVDAGFYSKSQIADFGNTTREIKFKGFPMPPFFTGGTNAAYLQISPTLITNPTLNESLAFTLPNSIQARIMESSAGVYTLMVRTRRAGVLSDAQTATVTNLTASDELTLEINKNNLVLKRNGTTAVSSLNIPDIPFTTGYLYFGLLTNQTTLQTVSFDDIWFPTA